MKHEDVIERLQRIREIYQNIKGDYTTVEAINIAISALEEKERNKVHCGECKYMLGGYSGYYECSKNHWRVYKAYSCKDGERRGGR